MQLDPHPAHEGNLNVDLIAPATPSNLNKALLMDRIAREHRLGPSRTDPTLRGWKHRFGLQRNGEINPHTQVDRTNDQDSRSCLGQGKRDVPNDGEHTSPEAGIDRPAPLEEAGGCVVQPLEEADDEIVQFREEADNEVTDFFHMLWFSHFYSLVSTHEWVCLCRMFLDYESNGHRR